MKKLDNKIKSLAMDSPLTLIRQNHQYPAEDFDQMKNNKLMLDPHSGVKCGHFVSRPNY